MASSDVDSLTWLVEWGETLSGTPAAPLGLSEHVLVLHPFVTPDDEEHTWHELAAGTGVLIEPALRIGRPDPRPLRDRRPTTLGALNLPAEGIAPRPIRLALVEALGKEVGQAVTVGLYGGWGQPVGIETSVGPVEVAGLEYWFTRAEGAEFLDAWATDEDHKTTRQWDRLVAFVWPDSRNWFLNIDPDAFHTDLYASPEVLARLTATSVETYQPGR